MPPIRAAKAWRRRRRDRVVECARPLALSDSTRRSLRAYALSSPPSEPKAPEGWRTPKGRQVVAPPRGRCANAPLASPLSKCPEPRQPSSRIETPEPPAQHIVEERSRPSVDPLHER